ncbi:MAG TPA: AEC family transporter [Candidatus Obscuribacterales bacterium]|jgi:hypothetical protein
MVDSLFRAYAPLVIWISLGLLLFRFIPANFSVQLGRGLYWVGVPLQSIAFARETQLSQDIRLVPLVVLEASLLSMGLAFLSWWGWHKFYPPVEQSLQAQPEAERRSRLGSFILAAMLGNTGFIGMALANVLIQPAYWNWAVLYSVGGTITSILAVLIASHFGQRGGTLWWIPFRDAATLPSLWAFGVGLVTQDMPLPPVLESGLQAMVWVVFASALLLVGLRLGSLNGWSSLKLALVPTLIKMLVVPLLIGVEATYLGLTGEPRLVLVLMSGAPTGLATLILAEVYDLDREILTGAIALSLVGLLLVLPLWIAWFS